MSIIKRDPVKDQPKPGLSILVLVHEETMEGVLRGNQMFSPSDVRRDEIHWSSVTAWAPADWVDAPTATHPDGPARAMLRRLCERHSKHGLCICCGRGPKVATTDEGVCKHCVYGPEFDEIKAALYGADASTTDAIVPGPASKTVESALHSADNALLRVEDWMARTALEADASKALSWVSPALSKVRTAIEAINEADAPPTTVSARDAYCAELVERATRAEAERDRYREAVLTHLFDGDESTRRDFEEDPEEIDRQIASAGAAWSSEIERADERDRAIAERDALGLQLAALRDQGERMAKALREIVECHRTRRPPSMSDDLDGYRITGRMAATAEEALTHGVDVKKEGE